MRTTLLSNIVLIFAVSTPAVLGAGFCPSCALKAMGLSGGSAFTNNGATGSMQ